MEFILTEEDWGRLTTASRRAQSTPVMLVGGVDLSASALDDVHRLWDEFAETYGFVADTVRPLDEARRAIDATPRTRPDSSAGQST